MFDSLVGRFVQVYKGGPEATVGMVVEVNEDFLVLQTVSAEMIYYTLKHIKSIIEDSQARFNVIVNPLESTEFTQAQNVQELYSTFIGEVVRINRGGPESRIGTFIDSKGDYFALFSESDGLLIYPKEHIKSLSRVVIENNGNNANLNNGNQQKNANNALASETMKAIFNEVAGENLSGFLANIKYYWVKINRDGPESIEGLLVDSTEDYLVVVVNRDVLRFPLFHLKSISFSIASNNQQPNNTNENKQLEAVNESKDKEKEAKKRTDKVNDIDKKKDKEKSKK